MQAAKVEISHKTIVFTVLFLIFLLFLYKIRYIILLLFIAIIFMSALSPIVDRMQKLKIPRGISIIIIYLLIWALISTGIASLVPPLIEQTSKFITRLPQDLDYLSQGKLDLSFFTSQLQSLPNQILKIVLGLINNIVNVFTLMVITFYLILERKNLHKYLVFLFGKTDREKRAEKFLQALEKKLGFWMRGQISLMLIVGLMSYLGLVYLKVEFALPLALMAGLLEVIPNVGPALAMIPAVIVAFGASPVQALAVTALYIVIQQLENQLIVPKVMSKAVGLSPLIVIISLLIGYTTAGVAGAVLSLPFMLLLRIIVNDIYHAYYKK